MLFLIVSRFPVTLEATIGNPIDIASKILIGWPSYKEVDRNQSDS